MPDKINSFTDLQAWQESHKLVLGVFNTFDKLPQYDALRGQIERSALFITSNIAERFGRQSLGGKKHFYVIARGSAFEIQNQLLVARDTSKISEDDFQALAQSSLNSTKLLHRLIRSLTRTVNANSYLLVAYVF